MKLWVPPNSPCIRCNGVIEVVDGRLVCSGCGQPWTIGPEGCWEAELEQQEEALKEHLEDIAKAAREFAALQGKTNGTR